ncbi:MAG TPA: hypothetical protein EYP85_09235 [Armatimonadetes bacterium]|nr:hypothetical protein [Armatimonadota bacterium]
MLSWNKVRVSGRRGVWWLGVGLLLVGLSRPALSQQPPTPLIKTYLVDPATVGADKWKFESYIVGLWQNPLGLQGLLQGQTAAQVWPAASRFTMRPDDPTDNNDWERPFHPFHLTIPDPTDPSQEKVAQVWVEVRGLPSQNQLNSIVQDLENKGLILNGNPTGKWRFKFYPPDNPPPAISYYFPEVKPTGTANEFWQQNGNNYWEDQALEPDNPTPTLLNTVKDRTWPTFTPDGNKGGSTSFAFEDSGGTLDDSGIGTIEVQFEWTGEDPNNPGVPVTRYSSLPVQAIGQYPGGGPIVVRFLVSRLHIPPQFADEGRTTIAARKSLQPQPGEPQYPQDPLKTPTDPNTWSDPENTQWTHPVFLVGYVPDENAATEPYYFPFAPGSKSPDKEFRLECRGKGFNQSNQERLVFQSVESIAVPKGLPGAFLRFEALTFAAPQTLLAGAQAPAAFSARIPRFQPPSNDALARDGQQTLPNTSRYEGRLRAFIDGDPHRPNGSWDANLYRWTWTDGGQTYSFEQFDEVLCADPRSVGKSPTCPLPSFKVEEFETFDVQLSVPVERKLVVREETVDLGLTAHGLISRPVEFTVENQGNVPLGRLKAEATHLFRTDVDTEVGTPRQLCSQPVLRNNLLYLGLAPALNAAAPGSLAGLAQTPTLQVGWENESGITPTTLRIPVGQPLGTYAGQVRVYDDRNDNGQHDPGEPFDRFTVKVKIVESPLAKVLSITPDYKAILQFYNDNYAGEVLPTALVQLDPGGDHTKDVLWVCWASNRIGGGGAPTANSAWNIYSAYAYGDPTSILNYRNWIWSGMSPVVPPETTSNVRNLYPSVAADAGGKYWLFWHREGKDPATGQYTSSLIYYQLDTSQSPPAPTIVPLTDTHLPKQAPRAFVDTSGTFVDFYGRPHANPVVWLFWHSSAGKHTRLYFNAFEDLGGGSISDVFAPPSGNPNLLHDYGLRTTSGLAGVKDAAPVPEYGLDADPTALDRINLFYTGWSEVWRNEDLYWSRYLPEYLADGNYEYAFDAYGNRRVVRFPYGRQPFPRRANKIRAVLIAGTNFSPGDHLTPNATGTTFRATHPDWYVTPRSEVSLGFPYGTQSNSPGAAGYDPGLYDNPRLYLARARTDRANPNDPNSQLRAWPVEWSTNPNLSYYDAENGEYLLTLTAPSYLTGLRVKLNPAQGTVTFSRPLYAFVDINENGVWDDLDGDGVWDEPVQQDWQYQPGEDEPLIFKTRAPYSTLAVSNEVVEVYADYTTGTWRVTQDPGNDSRPSAVLDGLKRMFIAWQRTSPTGRTSLWYTLFSNAIQVNNPPLSNLLDVRLYGTGATLTPGVDFVYNANGYLYFQDWYEGQRVQVTYVGYPDARGITCHSEVHQVGGFTPERPVPMDTVVSESQVAAVPETFLVQYGTDQQGNPLTLPAVKYWLFWSSTRDRFDEATQAQYRSGDIYFGALVPSFPAGTPTSIPSGVICP